MNISRLVKANDGKVFAIDWGIELSCGECGAEYVDIRTNGILHGSGVNSFRIVEVSENPFSLTATLFAREDASPMFWEASKNLKSELEAGRVRISFPPENYHFRPKIY